MASRIRPLHKMTDPAFCHNRNGYSLLNAFDHLRIAHAGNAACRADVRRNTLRHNCARACLFPRSFACSGVVTSMITLPFNICATAYLTHISLYSFHLSPLRKRMIPAFRTASVILMEIIAAIWIVLNIQFYIFQSVQFSCTMRTAISVTYSSTLVTAS